MRLTTAVQHFDTQLRADGKSLCTRAAYLHDLRRLTDWLGSDADIRTLSPSCIAEFLASSRVTLRADGKTRDTISLNRTKTALRMFFKFLADVGYLEANPARLIKNSRTEPKTPEYFKSGEARRFLAAIPTSDGSVARRDRVMFTVLLQTGIRLGALVQLSVGDVRLNERTLRINGKGGTEQSVYTKASLRRLLRTYIASAGLAPDDPLFPSRSGRPLGRRQVQLRFHHWLTKSGIKRHLTLHSTRHTFAMNLYRQTGDLRLVQTALGHRHISTTEIYARVEDKALQRALERL